ncbi:alpha/beta hydrolase [Candidatus Methanomassiliicoccus intestinalis]|jgi:PGAP1|uniref:Serine aminopeptidase S33 domain-containing protein n=1 Tax=Candidatus Methanomassiliicoccus intestinalis TaxID=1406512 RepID=A0A8J8PGL5_9ARCH|nr:MAG: hypothetical protein A3206_07420 [Candidatus Methanomassiliicoccus intestinalis]TQS84062.1 MAG: hypothetical protein A3207_07025 [Candidatus Methanomassiliicoccus intestinalis]
MVKKEGRWATVAAFIVAIVIFLASVFVCISNDTSEAKELPVAPEKQELIDLSEHYMEELRSGNIDAVYEDTLDEFKAEITFDEFTQLVAGIFQKVGHYIQTNDSIVEIGSEYDTVVLDEEYSRFLTKTIFVYDDASKIAGFAVQSNGYNAESSDKWHEVALSAGQSKYPLEAALTLPDNVEKAPVVILVAGSGPTDLNETIGAAENAPLKDIAHGLADQGIASLRFDKHAYDYGAVGFPENFTVYDEYLYDVNAIIDQVSQRNDIDANRIYVLGHSQGGMLVPMIANENPEVKGIISMAGTLRNFEDIQYDQSVLIIKQSGLSEAEEELTIAILTQQLEEIKNIQEGDTGAYWGMPASYLYSMNSVDRVAMAKALEIPMLILQGADDFQVYADVDYVLWQETLADKDNVTYHLYDGLNHLFMESDSQKDVIDITVYDAPANVDQRVIDDIASWINSLN